MIRVEHPAPPEALVPLIRSMSERDFRELCDLTHGSPLVAMEVALSRSAHSWCGRNDQGQPVGIGGVNPASLHFPFIWMIAAEPLIDQDKRGYLRASRAEVDLILQRWPRLHTRVDGRWEKSLRWLGWLGFAKVADWNALGRSGSIMEISRRCPNLS